MTKLEIESFSNTTNAAVIRIPGRQFPGIVLQGDSLKILLDLAQEIARLSRDTKVPELADSADELKRILAGYIEVYERALKAHNHELPYSP